MNSKSMKKKVLVTGAEGSLGSYVVEEYLKEGYEVTGTCLALRDDLRQADSLQWVQVDLSDSHSVRAELGGRGFDILVHCAGGFRFALCDQLKDEDLDFLLNTNLRSAFLLVRELLPSMKENNFGRIVFVSAKATLSAGSGLAAYAASKAGLNMLTAALAAETKAFNITVNAVLPSTLDTAPNRAAMPDANFSQWVSPKALSEIIYSLTSNWGNPIHGALLPVAGRV